LTGTEAISGTVLVVAPCSHTNALLGDPVVEHAGLAIARAETGDEAIARVESGEHVDVVVLAPRLADPIRVAQRMHSLDRDGALIVLTEADGEADLRHALSVAPFLSGDVTMAVLADAGDLAERMAAAAARTHARRREGATDRTGGETPPPLSARYLGTLLDSVPLGVVTLDETGAVIGWNKRTGEMLDVPEVEALGKPFADVLAPADRPRLDALIAGLGASGLEDEGQAFHRGDRVFEVTGARFGIRSGETGTLLILQDVTKRVNAERELRLQKVLSDAQADTSMVGIVVTTLEGELERANKRFAEIWNIDVELMRADRPAARRRLLDQVESPEQFVAGLEALKASGSEYQDELVLKDGRVIERYATYVRDDGGQVLGRIWFHTDITEHRREEDALRFLADATNLLSSSLEYETTLRRVADLAVPKMADWCTVEIGDPRDHHAVAIAHSDPEMREMARTLRELDPSAAIGVVATAIATGKSQVYPLLSDDDLVAAAQDEEHLRIMRALNPRSVMVVPIKVRERVFGAINFIRSAAARPYEHEDLELAEELARRAAIAIDNARVHAELRETARTLQESLLPLHLPTADGLELAARFRPAAGVGMQVGGDFYDIFETSPRRWAIAVGDVCGKGAEAAALTALTRYTVRAAAMYEEDGSGVLRVLNEALLRQRGDYRFTTLAIGIIDLASSPCLLRVACAGHPRPLLLRLDGTTEAVGGKGPLLGVMSDATFEDVDVELGTDDAIVLYTDGLTDALAPEQILTESDLLAALAECRGLGAGEISQRLELVALGGDASRVPRDDIALVVARLR
jgi:PAS domain S-box-containing protein